MDVVRRKLVELCNRTYADFLMPSRLGSYRRLLEQVLSEGYRICSVRSFWNKARQQQLSTEKKYLVLRHDVDTDSGTARAMWQIERSLQIESSYFFRLSTLDVELMIDIAQSGGEASYHYEELAQVAKEKHLKAREQVLDHMPCIRERFRINLEILRKQSGLPLDIVASHGDFVNRKLRMYNWEILTDDRFRKSVGIELEVYDEPLMRIIGSRHSDALYPLYWKPRDPFEAVRAGIPAIYVLVHPRHWHVNWQVNFTDDLRRMIEGARYALPSAALKRRNLSS